MTTTIKKIVENDLSGVDAFTPSSFIAVVNQTLEYAYSGVTIVGEVASFKVNQGKWVFFDLKDEESSISCFMTLWSMRQPLEDGMKVVVRGVPKLTKWGKFSLTVSQVQPVGEGSLKKAYEILKKKLSDEGLFDPERKRSIPKYLDKIGVISSTQAAGYADFIKIINARWGGMEVMVAHTQVQGMDAPDQIIRALKYFNERTDVQVIAILRGGGSADDLACFNDEQLVRAVAASKIPVITGIGHEVDESLCDLAADIRASTPSNAAEKLTPDRENIDIGVSMIISNLEEVLTNRINSEKRIQKEKIIQIKNLVETKITDYRKILSNQIKMIAAQNPERVLQQGYAIVSGKISPGGVVKITTYENEITASIQEIIKRSKDE
ncbi:exodeoxyribonuclease VII large subunit [Candidatus Saccharibacteria bacterium]|nr:exodeoxyribonuclease VII large subunit [Candidatus Saccharibacteria bacterium]